MTKLRLEAAGGQIVGDRERQEDSFEVGAGNGVDAAPHVSVLADGMGGHVEGALAAEAVNSAFMDALSNTNGPLAPGLKSAARAANVAVAQLIHADTSREGMGSTLLGVCIENDLLSWVSIGDSLLYLLRGKTLYRLNADHSLAPQVDAAAERGEITFEEARNSPRRSILRSAITGQDIALIDLNTDGNPLYTDDLVILASDGVETLDMQEITTLLCDVQSRPPKTIVEALLDAVAARQNPKQDNTTVIVLKMLLENTDDISTRPVPV